MFPDMKLITVLICFTVVWHYVGADKSVCRLPADPGPCKGYFPKWFFDKKAKKCTRFIYGGCKGNANRFDTEEGCIEMCGCKLPYKKGPCKAKLKRWFYDKKAKKCELFYYGGCKGNANRFDAKRECQKVCEGRCKQPAEVGPCKGHFRRYYYDNEDGKCKKFIYGGCEGNANNFKTKAKCAKACYIYSYVPGRPITRRVAVAK